MANNKSGAKRRASTSKSAYKKGKSASKNNAVQDEVLVVLVIAFSVLLLFSTFGLLGKVGRTVGSVLFGLFGIVSYIFPFFLAFMLLFMIYSRDSKRVQIRCGSGAVFVAMLCVIAQFTFGRSIILPFGRKIGYFYTVSVENHKTGGFIGGVIGYILKKFLGSFGAWVIVLALAFIAVVLFTEISVAGTAKDIGRRAAETNKRNRAYRSQKAEIYEKERQGRIEQAKLRGEEREISRQKRLAEQEKKREAALTARNERAEAARIAREENAQRIRDEQRALYLKQQADEQLKQKAERDRKEAEETLAALQGFSNDIIPAESDSAPKEHNDSISVKDENSQPEANVRQLNVMPFSDITPTRRRSENKVAGVMMGTKLFDMADTNGDIREITVDTEDAVFDFDDKLISKGHSISITDDEKEIKEAYERDVYIEDSEDISGQYKDVTDINEKFRTPAAFDKENGFRQSVYISREDKNQINDNIPDSSSIDDSSSEDMSYENEVSFGNAFRDNKTKADIPADSAIEQPQDYVIEDTYIKPETETYKAAVKAPVEKVTRQRPALKRSVKYKLPPVTLLSEVVKKPESNSKAELNETAQKLKDTFKTFGVNVTVLGALRGPSVTRYEIQPEIGVKVSKVVSLTDDIKLALAATDIRMEAPIPGKSAIGIEVPNKENSAVQFREIVESRTFKDSKSKISFGVGKDLNGQAVVTDIAKMPHVLIAGATGSGKSVCINTLIASILFKATPDEVRLIMIDPKVVELSVYNGIPHLLLPVVTDPKKASASLQWAVNEMMRRYQCFADLHVRDMAGYNKMLADHPAEYADSAEHRHMPQIVIIVDELADLMMVAAKEVEESICRLAQLARAAGIHLVLATQRPSVDVITGLIKANMPSRIAFSVSSGVDSRTILDSVGAEKLLGKGDMLFFPQNFTKPARVQGAFVSDDEVMNIVEFLKNQVVDSPYDEEAEKAVNNGGNSNGGKSAGGGFSAPEQDDRFDPLFYEAGRSIIDKQKASIGMLQRLHKIGFNRAARIMDQLADAGVVGPEEGTKPRNVLMTMEEFEQFVQENNQ